MAENTKPKVKEKIPEMFADSFFIAEKGFGRKTIAFLVSFLFFVAVGAAMIIVPLLNPSDAVSYTHLTLPTSDLV